MMKFPDIDFDAIGRMVDMLDDNQKEKSPVWPVI